MFFLILGNCSLYKALPAISCVWYIALMNNSNSSNQTGETHIKRDLVTVCIIYGVFLAGLLVLYYVNRGSGVVENFIGKLLNF